MPHALITGGAGFIGSHLVDQLVEDGWEVTVLDNFDSFYDCNIKRHNIARHVNNHRYHLGEADICDCAALKGFENSYDVIVHLAARAGVRPSIEEPLAYQQTNVNGTQNLLEFARRCGVRQFVFASSSSVYGVNPHVPWREDDHVLQPISPYASTKISGELLGHVYAHLYGIRFIGLRFFTVYGPRQRPDLAIHKFARLMRTHQPIPIFGDGNTRRDYTYVEDITAGIRAAMEYQGSEYEIINLGSGRTVSVLDMIELLEECLGVRARVCRYRDQPGDVPITYADVSKAATLLKYSPQMEFTDGLRRFVEWLPR